MLKCATSLWSADLANLAAEIRRVETYSERFHLDVADRHYVPTLLFFPDLVQALRPHTRVPFEVHLMTADPAAWVDPFLAAGADGIIFSFD
jgi:ribulose-phosphate 3-epimerase